MKRFLIIFFFMDILMIAQAQPEPYPVDKSFTPDLPYLQKQWYGEYNGVDPMSRARISIKRTLCLNTDMTFTNITYGTVSSQAGTSSEMLLKKEEGSYSYDVSSSAITYTLKADSALDMNTYLRQQKAQYAVNKYDEGSTTNTYSEAVQFTYESGGIRQWIMQDSKLGSDQMQGMPAVYVMISSDIDPTTMISVETPCDSYHDALFDINGRKLTIMPSRTIIIREGKKYILK